MHNNSPRHLGTKLYPLVLLILLVGGYHWLRAPLGRIDQMMGTGKPVMMAPDFSLPLVRLKESVPTIERSMRDYLGKPMLVHFFASWCLACRSEQAEVNRLWRAAGDRLQVLAIASYDEWDRLLRAVEEWPIHATVLFDSPGSTALRYKVQQLPASFLLDEQGQVADKFMGSIGADESARILAWLKARPLATQGQSDADAPLVVGTR